MGYKQKYRDKDGTYAGNCACEFNNNLSLYIIINNFGAKLVLFMIMTCA